MGQKSEHFSEPGATRSLPRIISEEPATKEMGSGSEGSFQIENKLTRAIARSQVARYACRIGGVFYLRVGGLTPTLWKLPVGEQPDEGSTIPSRWFPVSGGSWATNA